MDSEGSHIISKEDFTKDATTAVLEAWLGPHEDWEEEFDNIDLTNKKGDGKVLFKVKYLCLKNCLYIYNLYIYLIILF